MGFRKVEITFKRFIKKNRGQPGFSFLLSKICAVIFLFLIAPVSVLAQHGNNWAMSQGNGLNFNTSLPQTFNSNVTSPANSIVSTAISDCRGELQFYATNCRVWNKEHNKIYDKKEDCHSSSTHAHTALIPIPGDTNRYFWFHTQKTEIQEVNLFYSIINKSKNNGKGAVDTQNHFIPVQDSLDRHNHQFLIISHENQEDLWLVTPVNENTFHSYLISDEGHIKTVKSNQLTQEGRNNRSTSFSASPKGDKLVISHIGYHPESPVFGTYAKSYDFNKSTGKINNPQPILEFQDIPYHSNSWATKRMFRTLGTAFSPDGSKVYIAERLFRPVPTGDHVYMELYQHDFNIGQTQRILDQNDQIASFYSYGVFLGPDGRIYFFGHGQQSMHAIENPNASHQEVNFVEDAITFDSPLSQQMSAIYEPSPHLYSFETSPSCDDTTHFANTSDPDEIDSVRWYFGDGDSADTWDAQHVYDEEGTYHVQMKAFTSQGSCQGHVWHTDSVEVKLSPEPGFKKDTITYQCEQALVHLQDTSDNAESVRYDFGDGHFRDTSGFAYDSSGTYTIRQAAESGMGCTDTTQIQQEITVEPSPEAELSLHYDGSPQCVSFTPDVDNQSSGAEDFLWQVNDSTIDSGRALTAAIGEPDEWSLSLVAFNSQGCPDTARAEDSITTVEAPDPVIQYSIDTLCREQHVTFSPDFNRAHDFEWHFHDGESRPFIETEQTYTDSGSHEVMLTAANDYCTDTAHTEVHAAIEPPPEAGFQSPDTGGCFPHKAEMVNTSDHAHSFEWKVSGPQDTTSDKENPEFSLTEPGKYDVALIAHNTQGCSDTLAKEGFIEVLHPPKAGFTPEAEEGCEHVRFSFENHSQHADQWTWHFGDGERETGYEPYHIYREVGRFEVSQVAENAHCKDTASTEEDITIIEAPRPDFALSQDKACTPAEITAQSEAEGDIVEEYFRLGRGDTALGREASFSFHQQDTFQLYQHLESSTGCRPRDSQEVVVLEQPKAGFEVSDTTKACGKETWHLTDTSHHNNLALWQKAELPADTGHTTEFNFEEDGHYAMEMTAANHFCRDTVSRELEVNIRPEPDVNFHAPDTAACLPGKIEFVNESRYADAFSWYFGKGSAREVSHSDPVTKQYGESGRYTITLEGESREGCRESLTRQYYINIVDSVSADFDLSRDSGCRPLSINFEDESYNGDQAIDHQWAFGTGDSSSQTSPSYTYRDVETGKYEVALRVDNGVCSDTAKRAIEVTGFDGHEDAPLMHAATVEDEEVRVKWHGKAEAASYEVGRYEEAEAERLLSVEDTSWNDPFADPHEEVNRYWVTASDSCGNTSQASLPARNILLEGAQEDNEIALLEWNAYQEWPEGVEDYTIERRPWEEDFNDLESLTQTQYTDRHYFSKNGRGYCYRVRAEEHNGKATSLSNELCLPYESALYVPDAFSPGRDGVNEQFEIYGPGIESFEMHIYNRWGEEVFYTDDIDDHWDGTYKGELLPEGTYLYSIQAEGVDHKNLNQEGSLLLLR